MRGMVKKCMVAFSKDIGQYDDNLICRLESEGTKIRIFESRVHTIEFFSEELREQVDFVLISS